MVHSRIGCDHKVKDRITLEDGEVICKKCGCVMGRETNEVVSVNSITNLFQDLELGGKINNSLVASKYTKNQSPELSIISNICQAMELPKYLSQDVLFWFRRISKSIKMTKANVIVLVFYVLCRYNEFPLDESKLIKAIQINLNVKNVHSSLNVISQASSFMDGDTPVIEKIGFKKLMNSNLNFLLRSKIKSLHNRYPLEIVINVERVCKSIIPTIQGTDEDIVKTAFKIAKQRCGVC